VHLLYASFGYPPVLGGAELHLHELARRMQRRGHGVEVVAQTMRDFVDVPAAAALRPESGRAYEHEGVPVRIPRRSRALRARAAPWVWLHRRGGALARLASDRIAALLAPSLRGALASASAPDLVHAVRGGYGFLGEAALAHARALDRPFVFSRLLHAVDTDPQRTRYDRLARAADAVLALTEHERDVLVRDVGVAPDRVHVTGVGPVLAEKADVPSFRRALGLDAPYVLFVGRQVPSKGIEPLLGAAAIVWRERPDVHFVFVGPRTIPSGRLFARHRDPRIHDLGPVDLETKTDALAGCELLCLPSRKESFGGVLTEAWAFAKPVVASRIDALASIVEDGRTGRLAAPRPAPLAEAILALLRDPVAARALGEAGRAQARARYAWGRLAARTEAVYASLV
jgi:glycosyltransferase involved in cell wall biosynthesis